MKPPKFPQSVETFRDPTGYALGNLIQHEPSCFNGRVSVERYRVTVEKIEEPVEVIAERLRKLWRECDNHHHYRPLESEAKRLGIDLDPKESGEPFSGYTP